MEAHLTLGYTSSISVVTQAYDRLVRGIRKRAYKAASVIAIVAIALMLLDATITAVHSGIRNGDLGAVVASLPFVVAVGWFLAPLTRRDFWRGYPPDPSDPATRAGQTRTPPNEGPATAIALALARWRVPHDASSLAAFAWIVAMAARFSPRGRSVRSWSPTRIRQRLGIGAR
jgi:hypothetical protein